MADFEVTVADGDGVRVASVRGDVDMDTAPQLWDTLRGALDGASKLAIDLSQVRYIDSSGVAVLIQTLKHAGKRDTELWLREPSAKVLAVLELAQLDRIFTIAGPESPS